ncbi:MAG: acylneuraminate cytidylyltransferase family protein [Gammaproteobacteria bacterium]|jgi:CMP-N,N'-diacetyllegionaminic acid synthase|nr:acylneuraminate cytidylyltransferase family protein [Gammaproteobacteria bacterium]MBU0769889.1 acylneuraminate cytidylyltransferase family protein [Gammaproteobacteria bacterium]MBU0854694.1 acylneuraminate cytidylyltransferase family protein [Gammaproteobacteria bacterium]MBU1845433.1 acylneuraminate cytidylyltransferase family protein [Gammaproteobacteria bacterium]
MPVRILCTICARGGSKGVPNKNARIVAGQPLLAHTVCQARASGLFEAIAFSSDSELYRELASDAGVDVLVVRPADLASDAAGKLPVIRHAVESAEHLLGWQADIIVDLDCTSPLRLPEDVLAAVAQLREANAGNLITAAPARRSPYFNLVERMPDGRIDLSKRPANPIVRRQDAPECYDMNASIYVWRREALFGRDGLFHPDTALYVMPEERSIDIDSELDFEIVRLLLERRNAA